jgi:glycosyltransferase involved in cell wall biosynthesis
LATSFPGGGLRVKYNEWRTARALNHRRIEWIGNHNRNSSFALKRIGVDPRKIIPWDWPADVTPRDYAEKQRAGRPLRAFYAGRIQETKGIGDVVRAIALLVKDGIDISLTAAGAGDIAAYTELAASMGVAERVRFPGLIPHEQVVAEMHRHDFVLVPSQHAYPEGLPLTIYDAYCSRTPLVASDHPMFRGQVIDEKTALVFRGGDSRHMANALKRLVTDEVLYARLSKDSLASWEALQIPVKWGDLLQRWLENTVAGGKWLAEHTIASGRYAIPG